jgi:methylase of polypeptide subunit release factors
MSDIILEELNEAKSKLDLAQKNQALMKKANAILRKKVSDEEKKNLLIDLGLSDQNAYKIMQPDYMGRTGFPKYKLTNNNAKIKRLKTRVSMLENKESSQRKSGGEERYEFDNGEVSGEVLINYDIDRVQILFPGGRVEKPLFKELRSNGYVYSRTNEAFQRKITPQAIRNAIGLFGATKVGEQKPTKSETDKPAFEIGEYIKYPEATESGKIISIEPGSFGFEYKVEYSDGDTLTITESDKPVKGTAPKKRNPIVKIDGKSYDLSEVMLPEDHPIMILDQESPQWKSSVKEYFAELEKGIEVETEHKETLEKVSKGNISVDEAIEETAQEHLKDNPNYYTDLAQLENKANKYIGTDIGNGRIIKNITSEFHQGRGYDTKFEYNEGVPHMSRTSVFGHKFYETEQEALTTGVEDMMAVMNDIISKRTPKTETQETPPKFNVGDTVRSTNRGSQKDKTYKIIESQGWVSYDNDNKYVIDDGNGIISEVIAEKHLELVEANPKAQERTGWLDANDYEGQVYDHLVELYDLTRSDAQGIAMPHEKLIEDGFNWGTKPKDVAVKIWESATPDPVDPKLDLTITAPAVEKEIEEELEVTIPEYQAPTNDAKENWLRTDDNNLFLEWTEGSGSIEDKVYGSLEEVEELFKTFELPKKGSNTYVKNKIWFSGLPSHFKIYLSYDEENGDYNPHSESFLSYLNRTYPGTDALDYNWSKYSSKPQETPGKEIDTDSIVKAEYKTPYEINRAIERFLDQKNVFDDTFTVEEKVFIRKYSGYGGLKEINGPLDYFEFYTPTEVIKKMWALAYKYGYDNGPILEPSCGTGEFFQFAKPEIKLTGYDISPYSSKIAQILYPQSEILNKNFEETFIQKNWTVKDKVNPKYDMVIGNPPYGDFGTVASRYMLGMGEKDHVKARNYTEYFIRRGVDLLNPGGLLVFIVGASLQNGGTLFLDSPETPVKKFLAEHCELLDAYRLPENVFERTKVTSEIIVLKKKA